MTDLQQPFAVLHSFVKAALLADRPRGDTRPHELLEGSLNLPHLVEVYWDEVALGESFQLDALWVHKLRNIS